MLGIGVTTQLIKVNLTICPAQVRGKVKCCSSHVHPSSRIMEHSPTKIPSACNMGGHLWSTGDSLFCRVGLILGPADKEIKIVMLPIILV